MKKNIFPECVEAKLKRKKKWRKRGEVTKEIQWVADKLGRPRDTIWSWYEQRYEPRRLSKDFMALPKLYGKSHTTFYNF